MKISTRLIIPALVSTAALSSACAHHASAPPPQTSITSTTSAMQVRVVEKQVATPSDPNFRPETDKMEVNGDVAIDLWSKRYPDASNELADWVRQYPNAAAKWSAWDATHPIRMSTIISWSVTHRYEPIQAFLYDRTGWGDLTTLLREEPDGSNELIGWIRRSPSAAEELATHGESLGWAKDHLKTDKGHRPIAAHSMASPATPAATVSEEPSSPWFPTPTSIIR
jgi:hypothetical protein